MSESVIADFVAQFNASVVQHGQPVKGRVLLSQKRLVLAADAGKATIPLSSIFDVAVGHVPPDLGDFFDSTVTIAFRKNDRRHVAAVEAEEEKIQKFSNVLFKALLNGTAMTIKHPASVGGRLTDEEFRAVKLMLNPTAVEFKSTDGTVTVDLATVTGFERLEREIAGRERQVLSITHMNDRGQALTTLAAMDSEREMGLLGRYVRIEYSDLVSDLEDIDLTDDKVELLVTVYSTGSDVSLANVLDVDASQVTMLINDLEAEGLLVSTDSGQKLTGKGQVVVSNHLEDVNS